MKLLLQLTVPTKLIMSRLKKVGSRLKIVASRLLVSRLPTSEQMWLKALRGALGALLRIIAGVGMIEMLLTPPCRQNLINAGYRRVRTRPATGLPSVRIPCLEGATPTQLCRGELTNLVPPRQAPV